MKNLAKKIALYFEFYWQPWAAVAVVIVIVIWWFLS